MVGSVEWRLRKGLGSAVLLLGLTCALQLRAAVLRPTSGGLALPGGPPGHLLISKPAIHLGTLPPGKIVERLFHFRNAGPGVLQVYRVRTSCGCTAAVPSKKQLAAGEEADLAVTFRSGGFRGDVLKEVYLSTNDPQRPRTTLQLDAHVEELAFLDPDAVTLEVPAGGAVHQQVRLQPTSYGKGLRVLRLESNDPRVVVGGLKQDPDGTWRFEETIRDGGNEPDYQALVHIVTDSKVQDVFEQALSVRRKEARR